MMVVIVAMNNEFPFDFIQSDSVSNSDQPFQIANRNGNAQCLLGVLICILAAVLLAGFTAVNAEFDIERTVFVTFIATSGIVLLVRSVFVEPKQIILENDIRIRTVIKEQRIGWDQIESVILRSNRTSLTGQGLTRIRLLLGGEVKEIEDAVVAFRLKRGKKIAMNVWPFAFPEIQRICQERGVAVISEITHS
jgi:hypothetical protein